MAGDLVGSAALLARFGLPVTIADDAPDRGER